MPWERGDVLCPAPLFKPASPRGRLILGRPEASSVGLPTGHEGKVQLDSVLKAVRGGLPKKPWPTWEEKLTLNRRAAMAKWEALVWKNKDSFEVARNVFRDSSAGRQADLSQALVDCFAGKASATLHSRVGPLLRYVHFLSREHSDPFPLDEGKLYMFMDRYCRTAAATFARSFLETLLLKACFGFGCSDRWHQLESTRRRHGLLSGQEEAGPETSIACLSCSGSRGHPAWCFEGQVQ